MLRRQGWQRVTPGRLVLPEIHKAWFPNWQHYLVFRSSSFTAFPVDHLPNSKINFVKD
jgi:hypothetical protein